MLLFCDGMPRSASTWIYNVAFALLKDAFPGADIRRTQNENSEAALSSVGDGADWVLVKCHKVDENARDILRGGNARAIYSYRDIFDALASFLVMFRFPFDHGLLVMNQSLDTYEFHCETGNFLCVDYESVIERPQATIRAMAQFLGLNLPDSSIARIEEQHSFQVIKELSTNLKRVGEERLVRSSISCYDQETQWHVRHIRNGGIGYGRRYLLPQQIEQIEDLIRKRQGPSKDILPPLPETVLAGGAV
jgi:Sulfotransferase domain